MKNYIKPVVEITNLNNEDVVTKSGGLALNNFSQSTKGYNVIDTF